MIRKNTHYILATILLFCCQSFIAQDLSLKLYSKNKVDSTLLNNINYKKKHKDSLSVYLEINRISNYLKNIGYFLNTFDSVQINKKDYLAYYSLNNKLQNVILKIKKENNYLFKDLSITDNFISIPIEKLQPTLSNISKKLDEEGKSFSKIQLKNILIKEKTLYASLNVFQSKKRIINKLNIKGYESFPNSYLKNYFKITNSTVFNQKKINEISEASKNLQFIKETKPPEVLFTKDSTLLYLYLKKSQNNSFDALINFASKENGTVLFNGNIDLKLNNILNTGERIELFWNSIGIERQEFRLTTELPYLFNSKLTPELVFSIYKQDSTFLNTKFNTKLNYQLNQKNSLALTYSSESSKKLEENNTNNNIETFNNYFFGFIYKYKTLKKDAFYNSKFYFEINPYLGKRKTNLNSTSQFKIKAITSYIWDLNTRNSIYFKNETGYLNSNSLLDNELFRIGGANSIRGFNEQSIFTNSYSFFNIEYHYLTSDKSYLYTISDFGNYRDKSIDNSLFSLGFGYLFSTDKYRINIATSVGSLNGSSFDLNNTKLLVGWVNYF